MKYAIGLTAIVAGSILIYSGFRDVPIWDNILGVLRNDG